MENSWTSNKPINGLRHFVLVNKMKEKDQIIFLLVSVLDVQINLKINREELFNNGNWKKGWLDLPKVEWISNEYIEYKSNNRKGRIDKIFLNDDSLFNIS